MNDDETDRIVAAALRDNVDIPAVSAAFTRNCMSALSGRGGKSSGRRLFKVAATSAALASLATWAVTSVLSPASERHRAAAPVAVAAVVEDVSTVGVNTPCGGAMASKPSGHDATSALAMSKECMVNTDPGATALWKTLNAGQTQMAWEWPDGAKSAKLTITGRGTTAEKVYGKADAFPVWNPPVPKDFNEDDVFTAKLTFYNAERGGGKEVARLVAEGIGFVRGVSGEGARLALDSSTKFQVVGK